MPYDIPFRFQQAPVSSALSQADPSLARSSNADTRSGEAMPIEIIVGLPGRRRNPCSPARVRCNLPSLSLRTAFHAGGDTTAGVNGPAGGPRHTNVKCHTGSWLNWL